MKPDYPAAAGERPGPSEPLPALVEQPAERLLDFDRLDEAWLLLLPPSCSGYSVILRM